MDLPSIYHQHSPRFRVQTLIIYKLGFNPYYYTFTLTLLKKIVLCRKIPRTDYIDYNCFCIGLDSMVRAGPPGLGPPQVCGSTLDTRSQRVDFRRVGAGLTLECRLTFGAVRGHLTYKKTHPLRTLPWAYV